jgi:hypothetical protein
MVSGTDRNKAAASETNAGEKLSSEDLAAIVIDALLRAGIVKEEDIERAIRIATEEIDVRKALGDY